MLACRHRSITVKALALDFDGVISDSASEAYLVSLRTYLDLEPGSSLAPELVSVREAERPTRDSVRAAPRFRDFLELMPLGARAEDYAVLWSILERGLQIEDQSGFDRERRRTAGGLLEAFRRRFYEIRQQMSHDDPEGWYRLMGAYPEFVSVLRRRASEVTLSIVTAKDRRSVRLLLRRYGIADLIPPERILDKEIGPTKVAHLQHLQETLEIASTEITFLDDKVSHLEAVWHLGVQCALATWGYNGPREHQRAREKGYRLCRLDDVERQLFG